MKKTSLLTKEKIKKSKKKKSITVIISRFLMILCLLGGIGLLLYPTIYDILQSKKQDAAITTYTNQISGLSDDEINKELELAKEYNDVLYRQTIGEDVLLPAKYQDVLNVNNVMASLTIPSAKVKNMPIYHGTSAKTLFIGLGHLESTSFPVGGNNTHAFITGHSGLQNQVLFSNINRMVIGDVFFIEVLNQKLAYKVYDIKTVPPNIEGVTSIVPGKDIVTLQTCTPIDLNSHRLLVTGERIPYTEELRENAENDKTVRFLSYNFKVGLFIGWLILLLIYIYLCLRYRNKVKKELEKNNNESLDVKK